VPPAQLDKSKLSGSLKYPQKKTPIVPTAQQPMQTNLAALSVTPFQLQLSQAKQPRVSPARPQIIRLPPSVPTAQPDKFKLSVAYRRKNKYANSSAYNSTKPKVCHQ
jgi:hypothetical protein